MIVGKLRPSIGRGHPDLILTGLVLAWGLALGGWADLPMTGSLILAGLAVLLFLLVRTLAGRDPATPAGWIFALALLVYTIEVWVIQRMPPWADALPDATRHHLNALALLLHWQDQPVDAAAYKLRGLLRSGQPIWPPGDTWSYAGVLGMSRYAYQLYVAAIYGLTDASRATAVLSHIPWMAGAAALVHPLATSLFRQGRVATLATALMLVDTNFAVWGSVLLRESLLIFLVIASFLGMVRLLRGDGRPARNLLATLAPLSLAALIRFNFVGAFLAALLVTGLAYRPGRRVKAALLAGAGACTALALLATASPLLRSGLENSLPGQVVRESLDIFRGGGDTVFRALTGQLQPAEDGFMDRARQSWHRQLQEQPLWRNLAGAAWRSLMAPYPWGVFRHGFSGTDFHQLMIPGSLLWVVSMPLFFLALMTTPIRRDPAVTLCLAWLVTQSVIYIVGYGEFSMRQRMMAMPILWIFVARGAFTLKGALGARSGRACA